MAARPTIAVTGASGFFGRAVMAAYATAGYEVLGYTRRAMDGLVWVDDYAEIPFAEVIVHCAETSSASAATEGGEALLAVAQSLTRELAGRCDRLFYASSAIVYGDSGGDCRIDDPVHPINAYARMKLEGESIVACAGGTSMRLANLYGTQQPVGTVLADILAQLGLGGPLVVRNTAAIRDFLWVGDAAQAVVAMTSATTLPRILNIGSGMGISVGQLARRVLAVAGEPSREVQSSTVPAKTELWMNIADTLTILEWHPKMDITQGIAHILGGN